MIWLRIKKLSLKCAKEKGLDDERSSALCFLVKTLVCGAVVALEGLSEADLTMGISFMREELIRLIEA
ncbi:MAG: hypothetical protein E7671_04895 [Ruminococcaceae bacterium]|nr:hypothetical protein [Oscillospiraceae bacterium]